MLRLLWKNFPVIYVLPFLMATTRIGIVAQLGEKLRWIILALGFFLVVYFGFRRTPSRMVRLYLVDGVIICFLGIFLYSSTWSIAPSYTYSRVMSLLLLYISSFWVLWRFAEQFTGDRLLRYLLYTIALVLTANLFFGLLLYPGEFFGARFQGFFKNPNNIGILTCLALPLAISRWLRSRERFDLFITITIAANLILAGSRAALLGVIIAVIAIVISLTVVRPSRAILFALIGIVAVSLFSRTAYFEDQILREQTLKNASNRTFFWDIAKIHIKKRPYLGHGFGTDGVFHSYYGIDLEKLGLRGYGAMSSYYGLAVAMGWPVTITFYILLVGFIIGSMLIYWKDYYLITLLGALASGVVVSIFEPVIYSAGNAFSFLFWVCLMLSVRHIRRRRKVKQAQKMRNIVANKFNTQSVGM